MSAYDLDAAIREDVGAVFTFTVGGKQFTLPHQKDVDKSTLVIAAATESAAGMAQLKIALGEQWRAFDKIKLSVDGIDKLFNAWNLHSGVAAGE